jgi:gliding motility-associated-like protein
VCADRYISLSYFTSSWQQFASLQTLPGNELAVAGSIYDNNGAALLTKLNRNGIPLWSNYYTMGYSSLFYPMVFLSDVTIRDFSPTDDGGFLVVGSMSRYYRDPLTELRNQVGLLAKIDAAGNVSWSRSYLATRGTPNVGFNRIYKTATGDFIAYMTVDNGPSISTLQYSYNRVLCFDVNGDIKWSTQLATGEYDSGGPGFFSKKAITQAANGNIIIGDIVFKTERNTGRFKMTEGRIHITSLDFRSGHVNWESSCPYVIPVTDTAFVPDIFNAFELPGGQLSFSSNLYVRSSPNALLQKKPVTIIADNRGVVQQLISYSAAGGPGIQFVDVTRHSTTGTDYLFKNGNQAIIAGVDPTGQVNSARAVAASFPPNCFAWGQRGYAIALSNKQSQQFDLLLSDDDGKLDCAESPAAINSESIPLNPENPGAVSTFNDVIDGAAFPAYFTDAGYGLKKSGTYPLDRTVQCEEAEDCCHDVIDSANSRVIRLCEGSSITLGANLVVKDSGTYPAIYKTLRGCDSIIYYTVRIDKNTAALTLGQDTCLAGQSSALLHATPGFESYNWMGTASTADTMRIFSTGQYWVSVTNACGARADTVGIYDQCDFPVYMPTAFTPNHDNLNDYFGFPPSNRNRFINLKVFDRWGEIVFETSQASKLWDGKYKGSPAPPGVYIYVLLTEGLSGRRFIEKNKVVLIR